MCEGIGIFSNNKKAFHGVGTSGHSNIALKFKIDEDKFLKSEYHWWDKQFVVDHYDTTAIKILQKNGVDIDKATKAAEKYVKKTFTQSGVVKWLKKTPSEWGRLMTLDMESLAKKVNPKLVLYQSKIKKFKKTNIEKYNPYKATRLPALKTIKVKMPKKVWDQVWGQVRDQVRDQVGDQVWGQVRDQVRDQVRGQVGDQVWGQAGDQVWGQVRDQVRDQVWGQVWDQVYSTSYWAIKVVLGLPIKHWFFDFLKLGIMIVFVQGKVKVFGKKGKFLGEYSRKEWDK
jgi:hypothetical protein